MAYTKTEGYTTARETSLETSISSGSDTSKSTRNEYSVPFNNYSAANHLIKGFTISGVTDDADSTNGDYTLDSTIFQWTSPTTDTQINVQGSFPSYYVFVQDADDYTPLAQTDATQTTGALTSDGGAYRFVECKMYPWLDSWTWTDSIGDFGATAVFSNPIGSDFE